MSHPEYLAKMMLQALRAGDMAAFGALCDEAGIEVVRMTPEEVAVLHEFVALARAQQDCIFAAMGMPAALCKP